MNIYDDNTSQRDYTGKILGVLALALVLVLVFGAGMFFYAHFVAPGRVSVPFDMAVLDNTAARDRVDFGLFWNAWDLLQEKYVDHDALDAQTLVYGAINGMFAATGDPYTVFLDPDQSTMLEEDLGGNFDGIGAEIGVRDQLLTIIAPLDGSPAQKAGLRAGDHIIAIDGAIAAEMTMDEAISNIRGEKGTEVLLTIFRPGEDDTREVHVTRDRIHVESVRTEYLEDGITYIRVSQFGDETARDFAAALTSARNRESTGIIVDLRNNPGGYLDAAVDVVSPFVPKDSVVVIEKSANGDEHPLRTYTSGTFTTMPVIVLINEGSASASEIFAAALREHRSDVLLVGATSFGKGSVQEVVPMQRDTAAKITVAKWLTPNGTGIDGVGVTPQIEVPYTEEDYQKDHDPQRERAIEELKKLIAAAQKKN